MRHLTGHFWATAIATLAAVMAAGPAHALLIVPSFDLNPTNDSSSLNNTSNPSGEVTAIDTAISTIDGLYSNPGTVYVLFNYNSSAFGESETNGGLATTSQYVMQLTTDSTDHPSNTVLTTALKSIAKGNGANATYVVGTTAFLRVGLGFSGSATTPSLTNPEVSGTFDGIISIGNLSPASNGPGLNSETTSVVEHELDEVLGGGGTGTTIGESQSTLASYLPYPENQQSQFIIGPTDFYRYHASGSTCASVTSTLSFTTSTAEVACYSIDGGKTALVQMNEAGDGSDYGDFATTSPNIPYIQDAHYPGTTDVYSSLSPEFTMMESIGWDPLPEPSTIALLSGAIAGLGWLRRRPRRTVGSSG